MFFTEYAIERIGERKTIDIQVLTENLCSLKNRPRTSQYKKTLSLNVLMMKKLQMQIYYWRRIR